MKTKYIRGSIKQSTLREIARLSYFDDGPLLAKEYLEKQGVHLIVVAHLPKNPSGRFSNADAGWNTSYLA